MFLITSASYYGRVQFKLLLFTLYFVLFVNLGNRLEVICTKDVHFKSRLCKNYSLSCAHQVALPNVTDNMCQMIYHSKAASVCSNENFRYSPDNLEEYGKMNLMAYVINGGGPNDLAFNVSFSRIKWERLVMRFIDRKEKTSLCREFVVSGEVAEDLTLFFDCLWYNSYGSLGDYNGLNYSFQYKLVSTTTTTVNTYMFYVPDRFRMISSTKIKDWELFLVVDISNIPEKIGLRIQLMPSWTRVTEYYVVLNRTMGNYSWVVQNWSVKIDPSAESDGFIRVEYRTKSKHGGYVFGVRPIHPSSSLTCFQTKSPTITIVDMPELIELICIVGSVILTPILLMAYFMWRRKCDTEVPSPDPDLPPKMLLMYNSVSVEHIRTMVEVARYLRHSCRLQTMLDQIGIPESVHKDPGSWYIESFNQADFVGIFASPKCAGSRREEAARFSRYLNLEAIAMSQLRLRLCSPGARCKFFCIALPGTSWDTLPPEAQALKRYTLPRDLDPLLVLVGVAPQCDQGSGLQAALSAARQACLEAEEEARGREVALLAAASAAAPAPPLPPPRPTPPASPLRQDFTPPLDSCCPESQSLSDQDLLTSSQPYLSDTSSLDRLSLLGE